MLNRQMQMRHQPFFTGQDLHQLCVGFGRIKRGQAEPAKARKRSKDCRHKITKPRPPRKIASPGGDIDPGQHDFAAAPINEPFRRREDLAEAGRPVVAATIGDDAEGTAMITALLNLQETARMRAEGVEHVRRRFADLHDVADNDRFASAGNGLPTCRDQLVMIADDVIDFVHRLPSFRCNLCGAAGDNNPCVGIVTPRAADRLSGLPFGLGRHGAGIEDDGVVETSRGGLVQNNLRFPDVQPAAKALHARCIPSRHAAIPTSCQDRPTARRRTHRPPDLS